MEQKFENQNIKEIPPAFDEKEFFLKWNQEDNKMDEAINTVLDPVKLDNSVDAWQLRNSFIDSVNTSQEKIITLKNKFANEFKEFADSVTGLVDMDVRNEKPDFGAAYSEIVHQEYINSKVFKLLAYNVTNMTSKESLDFREKLLSLGAHPSYLMESLMNVYQDSKEATELFNEILERTSEIYNTQEKLIIK